MKITLKIVFGAIVIFAILAAISPTVAWSGGATARIKFTVIDDDSSRPIPQAEVIFLSESYQKSLDVLKPEERESLLKHLEGYATTDKKGSCEITRMFGAGGGTFLFRRTGNLYIEGPVTIRAEGYTQSSNLIQNYLGKKKFPLSERNHDITIYLKKK